MKSDLIVVGGGPAGMIAAGVAGANGQKTFLVEKNKILGKKLLITGKGRCNLTNSAPISDLIENIVRNKKFLYSAFAAFPNTALIEFFETLGVKLKVERGGRVFPASDRSKDIVDALRRYISRGNVARVTGRAKEIIHVDGKISGLRLSDGRLLKSEKIILATGGITYPQTGSTGDGHHLAKRLGHRVTNLKPALVPLECKERWISELEGLSLKNVAIKISQKDNKQIYSDFGDMIFTARGVSGPIILSASSYLEDPVKNQYTLTIDLKPALSQDKLDLRLQRDFKKFTNKYYCNALNDLLPQKLIPVIIRLSQIDPQKRVHQITRMERNSLSDILKSFSLHIAAIGSKDEAIITAGGVNVAEIRPNTMESKIVRGLYFAGEILDVHGPTGGYNLQIAFSTGFLAGQSSC